MTNFIDLRKAFDCIHHPSLWWIMKKYGISDDIIVIIQNLYEQGQSSIKWNYAIAEWFIVITGVRLGCILSPLLFTVCPSYGLDYEKSIVWQWIHGSRLCDLDYADNIILLDSSHERMQKMTTPAEDRCKKLELHMIVDKCRIMISNDWVDDKKSIWEMLQSRWLRNFAIWAPIRQIIQ